MLYFLCSDRGAFRSKKKPWNIPVEQQILRKTKREGNMAAPKKHPGFAKVQAGIAAKQGISQASAGAILASSTRKASPAAKRANPALKKVPAAKKK